MMMKNFKKVGAPHNRQRRRRVVWGWWGMWRYQWRIMTREWRHHIDVWIVLLIAVGLLISVVHRLFEGG